MECLPPLYGSYTVYISKIYDIMRVRVDISLVTPNPQRMLVRWGFFCGAAIVVALMIVMSPI